MKKYLFWLARSAWESTLSHSVREKTNYSLVFGTILIIAISVILPLGSFAAFNDVTLATHTANGVTEKDCPSPQYGLFVA